MLRMACEFGAGCLLFRTVANGLINVPGILEVTALCLVLIGIVVAGSGICFSAGLWFNHIGSEWERCDFAIPRDAAGRLPWRDILLGLSTSLDNNSIFRSTRSAKLFDTTPFEIPR